MVRGKSSSKTVIVTRESTKTGSRMEREGMTGVMGVIIRDNSGMVIETVKEF